ncbi:ATP-binding protein [Microcoleus vaginatus GB1-A2]|uniref:response regulator n=1 Tax=Microcoleus vaginatus TaxID=119532 RepID=UPI001685A5D9|nr:response regulator [Microcoleus sp. FACHB-61]
MPHNVSKISQLTPFELTSLEECTEESVYAPGHIQPHGIVLLLQGTELNILQVSENLEQFFGISAEQLLGQPLQRLLGHDQVQRIVSYLTQETLKISNSFDVKIPLKDGDYQRFRSTLHQLPDGLILELEPQWPLENNHSIDFYHRLQTVILNLRSAIGLSDLAQTIAREVKAMTGFDRVMVYRFEADDHGVVIAEEKESYLESYLGLHYPAIDIPVPARKLFYRNWVRQIPNINYTPARLIPTNHPLTDTPQDLSACVLRGVSPYHIEYLQNMGVAGTLTISLIDDRRLWGLIACHHYSPRVLDCETRKTCEFLGQFASIELVHQQERELNVYRSQAKSIQDQLQQAFRRESNFIEQVLTDNASQLLDLVNAQGAAILLDGRLKLVGKTPSEAEVGQLVQWLLQQNKERVFATASLSQLYPQAKQFKDRASGILAISIFLCYGKQKSYHILWFRPEQIQTINWAGNPQDAVSIDESGKMHLCPRQSFELWQETVREMSYPWQIAELEAAAEMRHILMLAVLEFSQAALEHAAERAAIANRAKSQFLANMSHELRTPLNAILGFTQLMNRSPDIPEEFQEHLGIISRSGEHLLTLIDDVLQMSRIEAGQLLLSRSCFNLHRLLGSINEMFSLKAPEKGLYLSSEWDATVPRYVFGDQAKLRQILINLLGNAIKFTTTGSIVLRARAFSSNDMASGTNCDCATNPLDIQPTITLCLEVEDTGSGISPSDLESIFDAFMQTDRGRHDRGTGLGLSISRQFARLMGGDITVRSTLDQGSTFTCKVVLELPKSLDLEESETSDRIIGLQPGQSIYRILVAEDVPENRQLLVTLLESVGFEVCAVENGAEAIARWQTWHPDLILMDIQMPVMDGYEATRQIRSQQSSVISHGPSADTREQMSQDNRPMTRIIALTAYAFEDDRTASLQVGCDDYMAKPFTEATLFDKIAHHLGARYCYAKKVPPKSSASPPKIFTPDLKAMPSQWIAEVHEAALDLNDNQLYELIAQIPKEKQDFIEAMTSLVDNFQLEAIANLTQNKEEDHDNSI